MKVRQTISLISALCSCSLCASEKPTSIEDWQLNLALDPPDYILQIEEEKDRVWILQGLYDTEIDRVLDKQFERIDHLMFIGTRHQAPSGETWVSDEGCD